MNTWAPSHLSTGTEQARSTMQSLPFRVAIFDFDKTITVEDTSTIIIEAARNAKVKLANSGEYRVNKFEEDLKRISEAYYQQYEQLMEEFRQAQLDLCTRPKSFDNIRQALCKLYEKERQMELSSALEVCEARLLAGCTQEEWQLVGKEGVKIREGALEVIKKLKTQGVEVYVLSASWCSDLIYGAIRQEVDKDHIFANDMVYDPVHGRSSGQLHLRVVSALDKQIVLRQIKEQISKKNMTEMVAKGHKANNILYMGDSVNDLLAIMEADIPVIMDGNRHLHALLTHQCLPVLPVEQYLNNAKDVFYRVVTWGQLEVLFSAGVQQNQPAPN